MLSICYISLHPLYELAWISRQGRDTLLTFGVFPKKQSNDQLWHRHVLHSFLAFSSMKYETKLRIQYVGRQARFYADRARRADSMGNMANVERLSVRAAPGISSPKNIPMPYGLPAEVDSYADGFAQAICNFELIKTTPSNVTP